MLALTDAQLQQVQRAAAMLPVSSRDNFLRSIANRLSDLPHHPADTDVMQAITLVLSCNGIATGSYRSRRYG